MFVRNTCSKMGLAEMSTFLTEKLARRTSAIGFQLKQ